MDDDDMVQVTAKKVPRSKEEMPMMPKGMSEGERPMPLTHDFHVTDIKRLPKKGGGSSKRPGPGQSKGGNALEYLKEQQADQAYRGSTKPIT